MRALLADTLCTALSPSDIRTHIEGNLWMLRADAFCYFLPAFMSSSLGSYSQLSVFASELVGALTEPRSGDVDEALKRATGSSSSLGLPPELSGLLGEQQRSWLDSGIPQAIFQERVATIAPFEGASVLAFLDTMKVEHGDAFPFAELDVAVSRYWSRYRT